MGTREGKSRRTGGLLARGGERLHQTCGAADRCGGGVGLCPYRRPPERHRYARVATHAAWPQHLPRRRLCPARRQRQAQERSSDAREAQRHGLPCSPSQVVVGGGGGGANGRRRRHRQRRLTLQLQRLRPHRRGCLLLTHPDARVQPWCAALAALAALPHLCEESRCCPPTHCQLLLYYALFKSAMGRHRDNYTVKHLRTQLAGAESEGTSTHAGMENSQTLGSEVLLYTEGNTPMDFALSFPPHHALDVGIRDYVKRSIFTGSRSDG